MALILLAALCSAAYADGELRAHGLKNLAPGATIEASSSAGAVGSKYGADKAGDGDYNTWWASADHPTYPVSLKLTFPQPTALDTLAFVQAEAPHLYTNWKTVRLRFSDGTALEQTLEDRATPVVVRFPRRTVEWLQVDIIAPHDPAEHYVTLRELLAFDDPQRQVEVKLPPTVEWRNVDVRPRGRPQHPCVSITPEDVARARERLKTEAWAQKWFEGVRRQADEWAAKEDAALAALLPEQGACFAYGFTGCPICGTGWGTWEGARCSFDDPRHVTCARGHVLPDAEHPDSGTGYRGPDGRVHYFVGSYNAWVVETLQWRALANLVSAHVLTGEEKYAEKAAFLLDRFADLYPSCDKGSWDYPSDPPSGRFCRPWYQVARVLVHYADWYDQLFGSPALDRPSVRAGLTRRANIELNLLQNGAAYCYTQSLAGGLHNGEADYVRGVLAVGCCLGVPAYVDWAYDGPYGILSLVRNNVDRDGRYFETSTMYADHTRHLYLTFAEPLLNYRSDQYPRGINLYDDPQFRSFYVLPDSGFACLGKTPRFGDSGPDVARSFAPTSPMSAFDYQLAERLYARVSNAEEKARFAAVLGYLTGGDLAHARATQAEMPWALYHAADPPASLPRELDPRLRRRVSACDFYGQKGVAILRAGAGESAQAALVRFGPSLNHGHYDDLNLNYYALGYEVTYDLGYGLGSTHTQVGWSRQTASHNTVLVDERTQSTEGSGTGGSLHALADWPGLKLTEVSSEGSYARQGVQTYRRLLALVGEGDEQYLVDLFRVLGGTRHDYVLHSLADRATFEGVSLGAPAKGSLAGPDVKWGALQLNDGDVQGFPNKPYWNPPPGNGLGFLMDPARAPCDGTWSATWPLPSGDTFLRLTMLGRPGTEVVSAWAPGIVPTLPKARYALARRRGEGGPLESTFIAVLEPYGARPEGPKIEARAVAPTASVSAGEMRLLGEIGVLLHKATQAGDELRWTFDAPQESDMLLALDHYQSPQYGRAQFVLDGAPLGAPVVGTADAVREAPLARLGKVHLAAGRHAAALRAVQDDGAGHFWFGFRALRLIPADREVSAEARPFIQSVLPLPCDDSAGLVKPAGLGVVLDRPEGVSDWIASAGDAERLRAFGAGAEKLALQGRFAHVRFRGAEVAAIHLLGARQLTVGATQVVCREAAWAGTVRADDEARAVIECDRALPTDGRLNGQVILFSSPRYSRNTAHRIARVEALPNGARILLESPSLILGTGVLEDDPISDHELTSLVVHEYARSNSATGTQFFSGKLIRGAGFATNIVRTDYGQVMRYTVDATRGMKRGAPFVICDVQPGDAFSIPTTAHLERSADGRFVGVATTDVSVNGRRLEPRRH